MTPPFFFLYLVMGGNLSFYSASKKASTAFKTLATLG